MSQSLVKSGARRRIGNDSKTRVFENPWLHDANLFPITDAGDDLAGVTVNFLMVTNHIEWDKDPIFYLFDQRDADLICCLPLNRV